MSLKKLLGSAFLSFGALGAFFYIKARKRGKRGFYLEDEETAAKSDRNNTEEDEDWNYQASESSWLSNPHRSSSTRMDLMHKGHSKGGKLLIIMVGLPGSCKTLIARKVARYLRWISYSTRVFSIAKYRLDKLGSKSADFFDQKNESNYAQRITLMQEALEDAIRYLNRGGDIAILDGTHTTQDRRDIIRKRVKREDGYEILWIESLQGMQEPEKIEKSEKNEKNTETKLKEKDMKESPDFLNMTDYERRKQHYRHSYQHVSEEEGPYLRINNSFDKFTLHQTQGFLSTKIVSFVVNLQPSQRAIYLCRHGQSTFNERNLLGGDAPLSNKGIKFSQNLAEYLSSDLESDLSSSNNGKHKSAGGTKCDRPLLVWTSEMRRTRETAAALKGLNGVKRQIVEWRALNDIDAGVCDGMTYEQIKNRFPEEYRSRSTDKLRYRYPRGESYLDVISRLEPVIFELERQSYKTEIVIVAHQAVLRCLYAYFVDLQQEEIPFLDVKRNTLFKLSSQTFGVQEKRIRIVEDDDEERNKRNVE